MFDINNIIVIMNIMNKQKEILQLIVNEEYNQILEIIKDKEIYTNYKNIPGLYYIPNFLTHEEIKYFENQMNIINLKPISQTVYSRRVAHFGYDYEYKSTRIAKTQDIPEFILNICNFSRLIKYGIIVPNFDQVIINEYKPNQKITYHTDRVDVFGPMIFCVTIGQAVPINFKRENNIVSIIPQIGSVYIMTDDARFNWQHSSHNTTKNTRYSITFRKINN
jgi:alkylated DNA repair dioxygenase AlkB